jgi:hypothetical protein
VAALATGEEAQQWAALERVEQSIAAMPPGPQRDSLAERARVLRGTLLWRFDSEYKVRLRSVEKGLRESSDALAEAKLRMLLVQDAGVVAPLNTATFAERITALAARIDELAPRLAATADAEERVLADIAVGELETQKKRLDSYATQAQFALAAIYDAAAAGGTK